MVKTIYGEAVRTQLWRAVMRLGDVGSQAEVKNRGDGEGLCTE